MASPGFGWSMSAVWTRERRALASVVVDRRGLGRHVTVDDVVAEPRAVALPRRAVAARAGSAQRDEGPRRRREAPLAHELALRAIGRGDGDAARAPRAATEEAERGGLAALEADARLGRAAQ